MRCTHRVMNQYEISLGLNDGEQNDRSTPRRGAERTFSTRVGRLHRSACRRTSGEYVPASAERLAWLTGFTGCAGLAVVRADKAAVFTDGRYLLQLADQTDAALW